MSNLRVGDSLDKCVDMGAIINEDRKNPLRNL